MLHAVSTNPKHCKVFLLGTSALVCFALSAPVVADDFVITSAIYTTDAIGNPAGSLPSGLISSSAQVIAIFNANFTSGSTMASTVDTTFATDAELFVTSSNLDAGEF